jgi:hypothetical protein
MVTKCEHPLCKIIARRSRGCLPNVASKDVAPEVLDEVRELLGVIRDQGPSGNGNGNGNEIPAYGRRYRREVVRLLRDAWMRETPE